MKKKTLGTISLKQHEEELRELRAKLVNRDEQAKAVFNMRVRDALIRDLCVLHDDLRERNRQDVSWCGERGYTQETLPSRIHAVNQELVELEELINDLRRAR